MDVLSRLSSIDDGDIFGGCMAIDLPSGIDCFDLPSPTAPELGRSKDVMDNAANAVGLVQPAILQLPDPNSMDLQECLTSPGFDGSLFGLSEQLNEQFNDQFMDPNFPFDMPADPTVGDMLDSEAAGTDLSSRVSKESSAEVFHDTPRQAFSQEDMLTPVQDGASQLGGGTFAAAAASQWASSYPANFVPAHGFVPTGNIPVSCPSSSSYARTSTAFPSSLPQAFMPSKASSLTAQMSPPATMIPNSAPNQSLLSSMLDALDSPNSINTSIDMLDTTNGWGYPGMAVDDPFRRQSESGSSCQLPSRNWQPVAQRKAVKRSLARGKTTPPDITSPNAAASGSTAQAPNCIPDPASFPLPNLPRIIPKPLDPNYEDSNSREGTPTPTASGQTEWLRIQMMKLMTSTPGCAAVPLRNLLNSPRAHSQPNSPRTRSPRVSTPRSRPGTPKASTPKARTPRGMAPKTAFQTTSNGQPNPSRFGAAPSSPTQRSKVARSGNMDVSSGTFGAFQTQYPFGTANVPSSLPAPAALLGDEQGAGSIAGLGGLSEQVARLQQALTQAIAPALANGMMGCTPGAPPAGSESLSRPHSRGSDKSTSSTAEVNALEQVLDHLAGSRTALEANGRLLHLQRSFPKGLAAEAVETVLIALKHTTEVEVVYFPNVPMILSEHQVELLISALQQQRIWALSLGEGTSLTAAGWELMANRLQSTALAYLYVSPATQASIPQMARVRIRDGLHANRRAAPPRDPVLLAQMQMMSSTPQQQPQPQQQAQVQQAQQLAAQPLQGLSQPATQAIAAAAAVLAAATAGAPLLTANGEAVSVQSTGQPAKAGSSESPHSSSASGGVHGIASATAALDGAASASRCLPENLQDSSASQCQEQSGSHSSGTTGAPDDAGPRSPAPSSGPTFADLVKVGLVQPGQYQFSVGSISPVNVSVLPAGSIQWEAAEFSSLPSFAQAVVQKHKPTCASCDAWKEVCLHGICLENLRRVYSERHL